MAHTKGPWTAVLGGMDAQVRCPDGRSFLIGDIVYHEENKANAHLIAAAPDLFASAKALREATSAFALAIVMGQSLADYEPALNAAHDVVTAAIAKAEGRG